ncbi:cytochrome C550 [Roseivivax halodurans JCM 10272]|uniref:Cytochrome C550 n=1 Tax=Roseivivax halodurans JCM 10272 TaxID=1449350 RepID=X7EIL8_9RHOB|nr:c-type cytochrome [Roseivivax halodurans]ETX14983.1 cytochrome C550 [Roseivivax halodurans JCM 10272]
MVRFLCVALWAVAAPAMAQDVARGEALFSNCTACHRIVAPDGTVLRGGGLAGPNLYGAAGGRAGAQPGFNYSRWLTRLGEQGVTWTPDDFAAYIENPTQYTKNVLGDPAARARMAFRQSTGAADIWAYLDALGR